MMAAGGFMQVQSSLRWFVDNFGTIADWRATLLRIASFRRVVRVPLRLILAFAKPTCKVPRRHTITCTYVRKRIALALV